MSVVVPRPGQMAVAWGDVAEEAARRLSEAGVSDAKGQARRLVEQASGHEGAEYFAGLTQAPARRQMACFDSMLQRRLAGEPLQYVLGRWGFRGLDLMVSPAVLIPRPETEVLAGLAIDELSRGPAVGGPAPGSPAGPGRIAVDLGTGSGAVGLAVAAECELARVVLTDASQEALAVARANLAGLGRAAARVSVYGGSWYEALPAELIGAVDVVAANPPYVPDGAELPPEVARWEPETALRGGPDGLDGARRILGGARRWLRPGGSVLLELSPEQMPAAAAIAEAGGLAVEAVHPDLCGRDRVLACRSS